MPLLSWVVSNVILALVLALAAWVARRWLLRPAIAHVLWVLALVKLVTPPLVHVPLGQVPGSLACALGICGCDHQSRTQTYVRDTLPWILLAAWSAGAGTTAWIAWRRWTRFRRLVAHASPAPPEWQVLADRLASELSIRCPPEILEVPGRLPPLVIPGRHRPCVLLPMELLDQISASQRVALLLHELVHIRRGDHLLRMLECTVGVVYWWLPIVGSIGRRLRACEEACCDAAVVAQLPESRREYAELLLDVIEFANPTPEQAAPQATAMSAADDLEQRLRAILDANQGTRRTRLAGAFAVGLASTILPCQLHYDVVGRPTPAAHAVEIDPAPGAMPSPSGDREETWSKLGCCPS
jgi:beta-lactamase regulating signal transducer with metallopeptidase domain